MQNKLNKILENQDKLIEQTKGLIDAINKVLDVNKEEREAYRKLAEGVASAINKIGG